MRQTPSDPPGRPEPPEEPAAFRFSRNDHLINLAFWTVYAAATAANFLSNDFEPGGERRAVPEAIYWFYHSYLWAAVTPLIFWLAWRISTHRSRRILLVCAAIVILVAVNVLQLAAWEYVLRFPPHHSDAGHGVLTRWLHIDDELITYAAIFAAGFLREQLLRSRAREERSIRLQARAAESEAHAAQLQAQLAKARLSLLRSQLNPHFLFNSLNAVSALVDDDPRSAQRMISLLSELLRFALEAREEEEIPLDQELMLTRRYLQILQIRYGGRLTTRISTDPAARAAFVPNLILQPLVENAMKHGVAKAGGRGSIDVDVHRTGDSLILTVRDSGGGQGAGSPVLAGMEGSGMGLGLHNTRARLRELYGDQQSLRLDPTPEGGMTAEITLPYRAGAGG